MKNVKMFVLDALLADPVAYLQMEAKIADNAIITNVINSLLKL